MCLARPMTRNSVISRWGCRYEPLFSAKGSRQVDLVAAGGARFVDDVAHQLLAVALASVRRVDDDVLDERVWPATMPKIRHDDQHGCGDNLSRALEHEQALPWVADDLL